MRSLGLGLIIAGSLATIGAMFLTPYSYFGVSGNWWQTFNGLDIALAASGAVAFCLAVFTLRTRHRAVRQLLGIACGVTFGLAFAVIPDTIHDPEGARAGLWIVAGTGGITLAGALVLALSNRDD
jgi:FtsH-binding integral membrane protein